MGLPANECRRLRAALRKLPPLPAPPRTAPAPAATSRHPFSADLFDEASSNTSIVGDDAGKECAEIDDDEGIEEGESNEAGTVGINGDSAHAGPDSHHMSKEGDRQSNANVNESTLAEDEKEDRDDDDESTEMARSRAQGSWWVDEPPLKSSASAYPPTRRFAAPTLKGRGVRPRTMQQQHQQQEVGAGVESGDNRDGNSAETSVNLSCLYKPRTRIHCNVIYSLSRVQSFVLCIVVLVRFSFCSFLFFCLLLVISFAWSTIQPQVVVPPKRLGAGIYSPVGMTATYRSFMHVVHDPNKWEGSLRSEAVLARYATLLSHTDSLVFVMAHNVSGRLVIAKPELPKPHHALPHHHHPDVGASSHEEGKHHRNNSSAPGSSNTRHLDSGGSSSHGSGNDIGGWAAEAFGGHGEGDSSSGSSTDRCIELRVYTPLAKCHTHRMKLSIDQVR